MSLGEMLIQKKEGRESDKVVFITGSSIGIGRESAYEFARRGYKVVVSYYKNKEEAEKTAKECEKLGASDVLVMQLNLMDNKNIEKAVEEAVSKFKSIDILINNAGAISWKQLEEQSDEEIENQVRTNLEGLIKITMKCLPHVEEMIINISSGAGKQGYAGLSTYCATKFGVRGFTQALASELANKGIKVYSVNPGMTATRMTNFKGVPAEKVAKIIFNTAHGKYDVATGGDVDVWEHL